MTGRPSIRPLVAADLGACAELLAARHRADRVVQPLLPVWPASSDGAAEAIATALARPGAAGVVALDAGRMLGYLIADGGDEPVHGRYSWVRSPGVALAEDADPSVLADLWTAAAVPAVRAGADRHHVELPSHRTSLVDELVGLEFGRRQTYAVLELAEATIPVAPEPAGLTIARGDVGAAAELRHLVELASRSLALPPAFDPLPATFHDDSEADTRELLEDPATFVHVAFRDGRPVGVLVVTAAPEAAGDLTAGPKACELMIAGVAPDERTRGVAAALVAQAVREAMERGCRSMLCDWRQSNLAAARFWPRFGFRPATVRMHRHLSAGAVADARSTAAKRT